jgi:hypothetical protein
MIRRVELERHDVANRYVCQLLWGELEATGSSFDEVDLRFARCA